MLVSQWHFTCEKVFSLVHTLFQTNLRRLMFLWNRVTQGIPKPFRNCIGTSNSQETPIWLGDEWDLDPPTRTYTSLFCISTNGARLFLNSHWNQIIDFPSMACWLKSWRSKASSSASLLKVQEISKANFLETSLFKKQTKTFEGCLP